MLLPKAIYFFYYAAMASLMPFLILYYEQLGLSGRQIGLLAGLQPFVMLVGAPLWSGFADATRLHRGLLLFAISTSLGLALLIGQASSFFWLIVVVSTFALVVAPIMPLVDNSVLDALGERREQYGKQRLWGAVGWGVAAPIVGLLTQQLGISWAFYAYVTFMFGSLLSAVRFPISRTKAHGDFWQGIRLLIKNRSWLLFLLASFTGGVGLAISTNFLFLYMQELGASRTVMGLALTVATISELPVLFFSAYLLGRFGTKGLLSLALLAGAVRLIAYSVTSLPAFVLVIQLLHGAAFSMLWVAGVSYAKAASPAGMGTTAQGIFTGVLMGLGGAAGALIGGVLYDLFGPFNMFRWAGVILLLGWVAVLPLTRNGTVRRQVNQPPP